MTTPSEQPESSEVSSAHRRISTPDTVVATSHTDALAALEHGEKHKQFMTEHAKMIAHNETSHRIIADI